MADSNSPTSFWALLLAVIIGGGFYVYGKNLERKPVPSTVATISVSGEGKTSQAPDIAVLNFGIVTGRQATSKAAIAMVAKNMEAILAAVKAAGVEEKDITTQNFWLSPEYDYNNGSQILRGYQANQSLSVKVRDLDKVGDVLTAATNAGANQAGGVSFSIDNPETAKAKARNDAIAQAKEKAQTIASSLGMKLGKVTSFSEGGGYTPVPMYARDMAMGAESKASLELPAGEQEITVSVSLTYELE
jgi:uncharacterized protein YggE